MDGHYLVEINNINNEHRNAEVYQEGGLWGYEPFFLIVNIYSVISVVII